MGEEIEYGGRVVGWLGRCWILNVYNLERFFRWEGADIFYLVLVSTGKLLGDDFYLVKGRIL